MNYREMGARRYRRRAGFLLHGGLWVALWLSDFWRLTVVERLVESVGLRGCGVVVDGRFEANAVSAKGPPHGIKGFNPPCIARPPHRAGDLAATCASFCWSNNLAAINCPEPSSDRHPAVWQCTAFVSADKERRLRPRKPDHRPTKHQFGKIPLTPAEPTFCGLRA